MVFENFPIQDKIEQGTLNEALALKLEAFEGVAPRSNYDLLLTIIPHGKRSIQFNFEYNAAKFELKTVESLKRRYHKLIEQFCDLLEQPLDSIKITAPPKEMVQAFKSRNLQKLKNF